MLLDWLPSGLSVSGLTEQGIALNIQRRMGELVCLPDAVIRQPPRATWEREGGFLCLTGFIMEKSQDRKLRVGAWNRNQRRKPDCGLASPGFLSYLSYTAWATCPGMDPPTADWAFLHQLKIKKCLTDRLIWQRRFFRWGSSSQVCQADS